MQTDIMCLVHFTTQSPEGEEVSVHEPTHMEHTDILKNVFRKIVFLIGTSEQCAYPK